ncbi:MAG: cupredoxin domain-containing protein [Chloroflexi bacterium]|nr:cupredoxin domain-containing protein [Chloroflexota bacterium]
MRRLVLLTVVLALSMAVVACGGGSGSGTGTGSGTGGGAALSIEAHDLSFTPVVLNASVGQTVNLTLSNKGAIDHDVTIPGLNASTGLVGAGASTVLTFTPTAAGTYPFFCSVLGHEAAGMKGTLTVS